VSAADGRTGHSPTSDGAQEQVITTGRVPLKMSQPAVDGLCANLSGRLSTLLEPRPARAAPRRRS
jgi:hypothetical protein